VAPQPSSLRTSFRALSITRIEIKESVIYDEGDRDSSNKKARATLEIELNDASERSHARMARWKTFLNRYDFVPEEAIWPAVATDL
jgi:hypothetical protein